MAGVSGPKGAAPDDLSKEHRQQHMRRRLFIILGIVLCVVALGAAVSWWVIGSRYVTTDNAYVNVSTAQVTPLTSGTVLDVPVHNTQFVKKGDILLKIDPADAQLAYDQARANYDLTIRKVQGYFATLAARQADLERAQLDYERRAKIKGTGAVSSDELTAVKNNYDSAKAGLDAAKAMTQGTDADHHPEVLVAQAMRDTAKLNLDRTIVRASVDGIVSQRSVQIGQRVQAGMPVIVLVPIAQVYVDANYKEDQLARVRPGQSAELTADLYGSRVKYHGTVTGIGGGTGSAFALIPAQNATGNWIKVVQRLPVRIALDSTEVIAHPLRVGLSMSVSIDVSK